MLSALLIDDDESINFLHEYMLQKMESFGEIKSQRMATDALDYLKKLPKESQPDVIFLDINMPAMNGWEFLDEFKKLEQINRDKTTVIMITSSINPADEEKAKSYADIKYFLTKPLNQRMLKQLLIQMKIVS